MTAFPAASACRPRWLTACWIAIPMLLAIPFVGMRMTAEVEWTASDFAIAALLLGGALALFELAVRVTGNRKARIAIGAVLLAATLLLWAEGAVGIV